ncbi:MAG: hypothetical protein FWH48_08515, partial [Oscillospiraceae bacterium]|nr:hypothetical protein [Oscillospiraceae bacterium]
MEYDQINRSAILELATYAMCESKKTDFENLLLEKVLVKVKEKLLLDKPSNDRDQALRYIEQVELAIREDPTIGQVTVLRTSFSKERDYESRTSLGEECDYDSQTSLDEERKYESPMDAVCFSD